MEEKRTSEPSQASEKGRRQRTVVKEDVERVGFQKLFGRLGFVVPDDIDAQFLFEEFDLLVITSGRQNFETFSLGELAHDLTHSTSGRRDWERGP